MVSYTQDFPFNDLKHDLGIPKFGHWNGRNRGSLPTLLPLACWLTITVISQVGWPLLFLTHTLFIYLFLSIFFFLPSFSFFFFFSFVFSLIFFSPWQPPHATLHPLPLTRTPISFTHCHQLHIQAAITGFPFLHLYSWVWEISKFLFYFTFSLFCFCFSLFLGLKLWDLGLLINKEFRPIWII